MAPGIDGNDVLRHHLSALAGCAPDDASRGGLLDAELRVDGPVTRVRNIEQHRMDPKTAACIVERLRDVRLPPETVAWVRVIVGYRERTREHDLAPAYCQRSWTRPPMLGEHAARR